MGNPAESLPSTKLEGGPEPEKQATTVHSPESQSTAGYAEGLSDTVGFDPVVQPRTIGRFRVHSIVGEGGFGRVYVAHDEELQRLVAIKVPRSEAFASNQQVESFFNEAQAAAGLKHPAIVTVYDIGQQSDGTIYVVLEYINGQSLSAFLREHRLTHADSVRLMITVAEAVDYAHKRGLIHRDLKPDNILLDVDGNPHVTDFGLAIREEAHSLRSIGVAHSPGESLRPATGEERRLPPPGEVAGTPGYMAPEQIRGETHRLDGRTDLWASV